MRPSISTSLVPVPIVFVWIAAQSFAIEEVVPLDANWKYLSPNGAVENPDITGPSFDSRWFSPDFDDSAWNGPSTGPFRYGTINSVTTNASATFLNHPNAGDRFTNYFRHEFSTTETLTDVGLDLVVDDGAVVYLDGTEVLRWNCCVDSVGNDVDDYLSFALVEGNEDKFETVYIRDELPPGEHLLAVSVHQLSPSSSDLGLGMRVLSGVEPPPRLDPNSILVGVDTTLTESGRMGPDAPNGLDVTWEWDWDDQDGQNHGLLWFDIPRERLAEFGNGTATLRLSVVDPGDRGSFYRMATDWISGPDGGDNVTWNNASTLPGVVPGKNAAAEPSFVTKGYVSRGTDVEFDVTADVLAWANGEPNYGWGILPNGPNGVEIASFESDTPPQLIVIPQERPAVVLRAGDADQDFDFDQLDLVQVQSAAKYLTGELATWGEGDWNGAPGGRVGRPPPGDGLFDQLDIVAAQQAAIYLTGSYTVRHATVQADSLDGLMARNSRVTDMNHGNAGAVAVPEPSTLMLASTVAFFTLLCASHTSRIPCTETPHSPRRTS